MTKALTWTNAAAWNRLLRFLSTRFRSIAPLQTRWMCPQAACCLRRSWNHCRDACPLQFRCTTCAAQAILNLVRHKDHGDSRCDRKRVGHELRTSNKGGTKTYQPKTDSHSSGWPSRRLTMRGGDAGMA